MTKILLTFIHTLDRVGDATVDTLIYYVRELVYRALKELICKPVLLQNSP